MMRNTAADLDETLTALLKERADRAVVEPGVGPLDVAQWGDSGRAEGVTRWWLAVAAVVIVIAGSALVLRSNTGSPWVGDTSNPAAGLSVDESDLIIWMEHRVDPELVRRVASLLEASPFVEGFDYVDQAATWAQFKDYFADEPEILELVEPEELPTSFVVRTSKPISIIELVHDEKGVDDVELAE